MTPEQQELLDRFADGAEMIRGAGAFAPMEQLDRSPGPGEWSARQVLIHLLDSEIVAAGRFRQLLAEENPTLYMYAQADWAERLGYESADPQQALELAGLLRAETAALLRRCVNEASWARTALHPVRGTMDLAALLNLYIGHVEGHLNQLRTINHAVHGVTR